MEKEEFTAHKKKKIGVKTFVRILRKALAALMAVSSCLILSSCWNYQDLDGITVVAGTAIDVGSEKRFKLSTEIVVMESSEKSGKIKSMIIDGEGDTIHEALENVDRKLLGKIYFGNMQTLVISRQIAEEGKISEVFEAFFRNSELRETSADIYISRDKTAKELITAHPDESEIESFEIKENSDKSRRETATTFSKPIFDTYKDIKFKRGDLALPQFRHIEAMAGDSVSGAGSSGSGSGKSQDSGGSGSGGGSASSSDGAQKDKSKLLETFGTAIFSDNKMVGELSPKETEMFLLASNKVSGGSFTFRFGAEEKDVGSVDFKKSKAKITYSFEEGKLRARVKINSDVTVMESKENLDFIKKDVTQGFAKSAERAIEEGVGSVIKKLQESNSDALMIAEKIYKKNPKLWKRIEPNWREIYKGAEFEVESKVKIIDTGFIVKY
jgi:spore germination protein KC